jgi:hypothetical protein
MAEEYLGFCFFEPGVDALDTFGGTIKLPVGKYIIRNRVPALKLRGLVQEFPFSDEDYIIADWMVKNKLNLLQTWLKYYVNIPGEMLDYFEDRGIEITGGGHNFSFLIPAEKYAEKENIPVRLITATELEDQIKRVNLNGAEIDIMELQFKLAQKLGHAAMLQKESGQYARLRWVRPREATMHTDPQNKLRDYLHMPLLGYA